MLSGTPVLVSTATSTHTMKDDIVDILFIPKSDLVVVERLPDRYVYSQARMRFITGQWRTAV